MSTLVILHPTDRGKVLSHKVLLGYNSKQAVRNHLVGGRLVQHLFFHIGTQCIEASTTSYLNPRTGGISNSELTSWLRNNGIASNDIQLLFEVYYEEQDNSMNYIYRGVVSEYYSRRVQL